MLHTTRWFVVRISAILMAICLAGAQGAFANDDRPRFDQSALDAMIAPIALYPDQLLSQVLMAATYPQEIEEAAHWSRSRPGLSGDAAVRSAHEWDWDPSVRSLTAFPHVLDTLARHMAWTEDLGHAFLVQPQEVMDTVQRLRWRAYEAGTLRSTESTRLINTGSSLIIESVQPQVVYVPHYDTRVVYGPWWWPASPPMYWPRWHGYYDPYGRPSIVHWGPGTWLGTGFFFGGFDWRHREVRVVNPRSYYYARRARVYEHGPAHANPVAPHVWRHDHARRQSARVPSERPLQAQQPGMPAPRQMQRQTEDDPRVDRRRRSRDSDPDADTARGPAARSGVNPLAQQPAQVQGSQRVPQGAQQVPTPGVAREARPQMESSDGRFDGRRRRGSDIDGGDVGQAPLRAAPPPVVNGPAASPPQGRMAPPPAASSAPGPGPQPRVAPPQRGDDGPSMRAEERRERAQRRD